MSDKRSLLLSQIKMHSAKKIYPKPKKIAFAEPVNYSYPSLYLNAQQAPMLAGKEVGGEVSLVIKCKITGHNVNENAPLSGEKKKHETFDLQIEKIGLIK